MSGSLVCCRTSRSCMQKRNLNQAQCVINGESSTCKSRMEWTQKNTFSGQNNACNLAYSKIQVRFFWDLWDSNWFRAPHAGGMWCLPCLLHWGAQKGGWPEMGLWSLMDSKLVSNKKMLSLRLLAAEYKDLARQPSTATWHRWRSTLISTVHMSILSVKIYSTIIESYRIHPWIPDDSG